MLPSPRQEFWVGEGGGCYNSGYPGLTNTFLSGFWWLDQLGIMAEAGYQGYCRQTLIGGNYGLLNTTTYHPNPDFYTTLLWHRLMGARVLPLVREGEDTAHLRAYAHCSKVPGAVALVLINLAGNVTYDVDVAVLAGTGRGSKAETDPRAHRAESHTTPNPHQRREPRSPPPYPPNPYPHSRSEYHFTAPGLHSQAVLLNGAELRVGADHSIPALLPKIATAPLSPIRMAPHSYAFVILEGLLLPGCE